MNTVLRSASVLTLAASALAASAQVNLVTNPGFETGNFSGYTATADQDVSNYPMFAHSGNDFDVIEARSIVPAVLSQSIATTAGASYTVGYYLRINLGMDDGLTATFGSGSQTLTNVAVSTSYALYSFTGVASGPSTVLSLTVYNNVAATFLDDLSVVANPAPEPSALAALGLGAAVVLRRRKRG